MCRLVLSAKVVIMMPNFEHFPAINSDDCVPIVIAGGGVAALMMAVALGRQGWACVVIAPEDLSEDLSLASLADHKDARTIAIMADGIDWLSGLGVWEGLAPLSAPLQELWIEDDSGGMPVRRGFGARGMGAGDMDAGGAGAFGWNVPAAALKQALLAYVRGVSNITLMGQNKIQNVRNHYRHVDITLDHGDTMRAQLLIAMDGAGSPVRRMIGIEPKGFGVNQMALVCHVTHQAPHHHISTEFYGRDHQITCIPMPGEASAINIVGSERMIAAMQVRLDQDPVACLTELTRGRYGTVTGATPPVLYPVRPHLVPEWGRGRVLLAAEAAHVMPPIGAQGLNISIGDVLCLAGLLGQTDAETGPAKDPAKDPGHGRIVRAYQQNRCRNVQMRRLATGALSGVVHGDWPGLSHIRRLGLILAADCGPVRQRLIQFGMGAMRG